MKFKEAQALSGVSDFHETFGLPVLDEPVIPSKARCELRISLLQEELNELKAAIEDNDLIEAADAFCDLQYVLSGAILEFGLGEKFAELFAEVQRSNMSKACETEEQVTKTIEHYKRVKGEESTFKASDGKYIVYRKSDGKVFKSIDYSPADLDKILDTE
jgi:predicted HAD superfamily Cof-like phosphohydrolase